MPSTSKKQHNLMAAVAHNPAFAKKVGISQEVGKHFMAKDKGKKFADGGVARTATRKFDPDEGSKNEAMRPFGRPDPAIVRSIEDAPAAAAADLARVRREQNMQRLARQQALRAALSRPRYAEGGNVDKEKKVADIFAKAGEKKLAAHERREAEGKEKDTPAIAKKEEAVLKRAKAPKDVQAHEKAEHKSMGYKKGGGVKKMRMGGMSYLDSPVTVAALPARMGAVLDKQQARIAGDAADFQRNFPVSRRTAPISRGMSPGNYARGGSVKKYAKQTKRGGSSARMARPSIDPAVMMGAAPQMGAPPMGGVPGMAHGGGIHHHHHYYAGGATQTAHVPGPEKMIKGKGKDGAAKRGRTKVRVR